MRSTFRVVLFITRSTLAGFIVLAALSQAQAESVNRPLGAKTIRMTMYDDGKSCPGNCDAHVVFDSSLNRTEFAHDPTSRDEPYAACLSGSSCEICLVSGKQQCLTVIYRGNGPSKDTFDLTPAFFEARCKDGDAPPLLKRKCAQLERDAVKLKDRINCFQSPGDANCKSIMDEARAKQEVDLALYDECKRVSQERYNRGKPAAQQRSNDCAYEALSSGGPNSKGHRWKRLMPGACRTGTYVGRDGLDCCSGIAFKDGPLDLECRAFYPKG